MSEQQSLIPGGAPPQQYNQPPVNPYVDPQQPPPGPPQPYAQPPPQPPMPVENVQQPQYPVQQAPPGQAMEGPASTLVQYIGGVQKFAIKERVNKLEVLSDMVGCCFNQENTYDVFDAVQGSKLMEVKEESDGCMRCLCKPHHAHQLHFKDPYGVHVMTVDKPFKCAGCCPAWGGCCQQESTLFNGMSVDDQHTMGSTKEPCCGGICIPKMEVFEGTSEEEFAVIEGPCCCFGGFTEFCFDQPFHVKNASGGELAEIIKERPRDAQQALTELVSDADIYTLSYSAQTTPNQKAVLLSSLLLLDYMFFETKKPWECNPLTKSWSITCCHMYLCGMYCPIKCGSGEGQDNN